MPFKLKFGSEPEKNSTYLVEDPKLNGYKILSHDKKTELFEVIGKTATIRGHYRIRRVGDGVALGSVIREQIDNEYKLTGTLDETIGSVKISENTIELLVGQDLYKGKISNRSQTFEFNDNDSKLCLTIDKKILSIKDAYMVRGVKNFPYLISQMLAVVIDDYFHRGPTSD